MHGSNLAGEVHHPLGPCINDKRSFECRLDKTLDNGGEALVAWREAGVILHHAEFVWPGAACQRQPCCNTLNKKKTGLGRGLELELER